MAQDSKTNYLLKKSIKYIQLITISFLYYARAIDITILTMLNNIGTTQAIPIEYAQEECK